MSYSNHRQIDSCRKFWFPFRGLLLTATTATLIAGILVNKAVADPVPRPPKPEIKLPPVFCFRFTDIKAVEDDPEGDKFRFEFEVLNWTNTPASGVYLALNEGTGASGTIQAAPFLKGATVDQNGRPLGNADDNGPTGNLNNPNDWDVLESNASAIEWEAGTAIPNRNLLGAASTKQACDLVPGCETKVTRRVRRCSGIWWWRRCWTIEEVAPDVPDIETVDNGINVLDGFAFTVDDWDEGEIVSLNWFLLDENGDPIGVSGRGNAYGFGTVNLLRQPLDLNGEIETGALFASNTGFGQSTTLFYNNVNQVTASVPTVSLNGFSSLSAAAESPQENLIASFSAEFGAGTTASFWNLEDNRFDAPVNVQLLPDFTPVPIEKRRQVPEPSSLMMVGLVSLGFLVGKLGGFQKSKEK